MKPKSQQNQTGIFKYFSRTPPPPTFEAVNPNFDHSNYFQAFEVKEKHREEDGHMEEENQAILLNNANSNSTVMEIESYKESSPEKQTKRKKIQKNATNKIDLRKTKSGRKCKPIEEILNGCKKDLSCNEWLQEEEKISPEGNIHQYLFCIWCRELNKDNQMAQGILFSTDGKAVKSFCSTRLQEHGKFNVQHKQAKNVLFQKKFQLILPSSNLTLANYHQFANLFEFILISVTKNLSISSIVEMVQFCKAKDFNIPANYLCYNSIKEIIKIMADEQLSQIINELNMSSAFSLAIDGSTDISLQKSICVNVLYLWQEKPKWAYLGSLFIENSTAKNIYKALVELFHALGIDYKSKLISICTDGEKVLRSNKNGLYGLLKKDIPSLLGIHCLSHCFSLVSQHDLTKRFPILNQIFDLAYQTYKYLSTSSKMHNKLLENEQEIEDLVSELNLIKPIKIRWMSLFTSIGRIIKILKAIILTLKESTDLIAKSLLAIYAEPKVLFWMHFLADISPDLKLVTTLFQNKYFNMGSAFKILKSMKEGLSRKYIDSYKPGYCYTTFLTKFQVINEKVVFDNCLEIRSLFDRNSFIQEFKEFCSSFIHANDKRFKDFYQIHCLEFFDLEYLKRHSSDADILENFSYQASDLISKLQLNDYTEEIQQGYPYIVDFFKACITNDDDSTTIYRELLMYYQNQFPSIIKLITLYKILPLTNNECERTFSEYTRTKTRLRSTLEKDLLQSLLQLSLNRRNNISDYEFTKGAIKRWKDAKKRLFFDCQLPE